MPGADHEDARLRLGLNGFTKHRLHEEVSRMTRALASPRRLELLEVLAQGERSVEAAAGQTGLSVANASQHFQVLGKRGCRRSLRATTIRRRCWEPWSGRRPRRRLRDLHRRPRPRRGLLEGVHRSSLEELTQWTMEAEKVLVF